MSVPIIQKTYDYSIFKTVGFNREKSSKHIAGIKEILQKENLLHLHPILVNPKMEVIDGQHRLEAAKELNLPVFYIQSEISYDHILNSNLLQKKLSLNDVIKFYACKDLIPDYLALREFIELLSINPKALLGLIFGTCSRPVTEHIKSGKFKLPPDMNLINRIVQNYINFMNFIKDKKVTPISMFSCFHFTIAYRNLCLISTFKDQIFYSKLEHRWFELRPQRDAKEWTKKLLDIYNWKNQNPIDIPNA